MALSCQYASTDTKHDPLYGILLGLHSQKSHFCQKKHKNCNKKQKTKKASAKLCTKFYWVHTHSKKAKRGKKFVRCGPFFFKKPKNTFFRIFWPKNLKKKWFFFLCLFINVMRILKHFESQLIAFKKKSYQCFEYFFFKNGENTILPKKLPSI